MAGMNDNEDLEHEETDTTQRSERTLRWLRRLTAGVVALTLVIIACTVIPLPYVARLPGPTVDVLGKTQDQQGDLKEILSITGTNPQTGEEITNPDPTQGRRATPHGDRHGNGRSGKASQRLWMDSSETDAGLGNDPVLKGLPSECDP